MDIAELGIKVVTDQAGNARLVLDDLTAAAGRAEDAAQDLTKASDRLEAEMKQVGNTSKKTAQDLNKVGSAGRKINGQGLAGEFAQVARQAAATGDPLRAVADSAAGIGAAFGVLGVAAGTLAGIALVSVIDALAKVGGRAKTAQEAVDQFGDSISLYRGYVKTATADTASLTAEFGKWAGQIREFSEFMSGLSLGQAMDDLSAAIDPIAGKLMDVIHLVRQAQEEGINEDRTRVLMTQAQAIADGLGLSVQQAVDLAAAFENVQRAARSKNIEAVAEATAQAASMMTRMFGETSKIPAPLREASGLVHTLFKQTAAAATETESLNNWWLQIKRAISDAVAGAPGSGWLAGAISDASTLAAKLWNAAQAKAAVSDLTYGQTTGDGSWYSGQTAESLLPPKRYGGLKPPSGGGGGGGGAAGNPRLDSLVQELQTEREILELWYDESLAMLAAASDAELAAIGGRNEAKLRLEQEYQERLRDLRSGYDGTALQQASTFFGEMADAMQGGNEKMLRIARTFGAAQSLINSYIAYTEVLKDPLLPWFARIPAAAGVLAAGMNMVNAIKGGGKGGPASPARAATPTAVQEARPVNVSINGIRPDSLYTGQQFMDTVDAFQKELKRRGVVFTFI